MTDEAKALVAELRADELPDDRQYHREARTVLRGLRLRAANTIETQAHEIERLREALELADCALRGANMNMNVVERKVRAALGDSHDQ